MALIGGLLQTEVVKLPEMFPAGIICMWSGHVNRIPPGWALCNGFYGTPDLRDRFILGVDEGEQPGEIGGENTHTHSGSFSVRTGGADTSTSIRRPPTGAPVRLTPLRHSHPVSASFDVAEVSHRPKYYKLAFIMKVRLVI